MENKKTKNKKLTQNEVNYQMINFGYVEVLIEEHYTVLYSLQTPARTQGGPIEFINHIILVSFGDLIITTTLYTILATIN